MSRSTRFVPLVSPIRRVGELMFCVYGLCLETAARVVDLQPWLTTNGQACS